MTSRVALQSNKKYEQKKTPLLQPILQSTLDILWLLQTKASKEVKMEYPTTVNIVKGIFAIRNK
jgi:hypothetical protein